jgi:alkylation response protein AidB-like acyl-CoA dehydrogenase
MERRWADERRRAEENDPRRKLEAAQKRIAELEAELAAVRARTASAKGEA